MDINLLHLYMELTAAACLFFIAGLNLRYNATGRYSNLMAVGTTLAGVSDLVHAIVPVFYPGITEHWIMMSWGTSRVILVLMFLMVFLCYDVIRCRLKNLAIILATPLIFSVFMAYTFILDLGTFTEQASVINVFGADIRCPFDFILLILWLITAIVLRNKSHVLFPPHVYWLFMSQGIMVHAIMSFASFTTLDVPALLAHALKISEYYSFILIYLLYKSTLDRRSIEIQESIPITINNKGNTNTATPAKLELTKGNK